MASFQTIQHCFRIIEKDKPDNVYYSISRLTEGRVLITSKALNTMFDKDTPVDITANYLMHRIKYNMEPVVPLEIQSNIGVFLSPQTDEDLQRDLIFVCGLAKHLANVQEFAS